ncbi:TPA: hypothetical protein ACNVV3_002665 [Pseudomonas putida]
MNNYQTVTMPRDLAERIAKVCMFTMFAEDSKQLRAILARPSPPVERDERAAFERAIVAEWPQAPLIRKRDLLPKYDPCYGDYCDEPLQRAWVGWRMRAWLEGSKPTVLSKCVLCDQLQADLTARDQRIDFLEQQVQLADHWLEFASFNSVGEPIEHTQDMRDDFRKKMITAVFPDYVEASTHGRLNGVPASPCAGCGTPGYTGNCDQCIPY